MKYSAYLPVCPSARLRGRHALTAGYKEVQARSSRGRIRALQKRSPGAEAAAQPEGAEADQQGSNHGPQGCSRRQLNNPAVASVYKRKRGWQPLAEAMFRWQLPGTSWSALQMLPACYARWYSYVHP